MLNVRWRKVNAITKIKITKKIRIEMKSLLSTVLCLIIYISVGFSHPPAALYVDNGLDQTMIERIMTKQEKHEMELEILNLLGLPNRPRRGVNAPLRKSAPRFLMDVYQSLIEKENDDENERVERSADLYISGEEQSAIDESDIIMTFESISKLCCL